MLCTDNQIILEFVDSGFFRRTDDAVVDAIAAFVALKETFPALQTITVANGSGPFQLDFVFSTGSLSYESLTPGGGFQYTAQPESTAEFSRETIQRVYAVTDLVSKLLSLRPMTISVSFP